MLDMSKAFDTVQRNSLIQQLKSILDEDELHIIKILLKDVKLTVRMGKYKGEEIVTNIGTPQGDCLSPTLFILYLACAMEPPCENTSDHNYVRPYISNEEILPEHLTDHGYSSRVDNNLLIDMQYADDTTWLGVNNAQEKVKKVKQEIPGKLAKHHLFVNETKTEEFVVKRNGDDSWKKCKLLGSLLDTEEDIKRRKGLAIGTYNKMRHVIENKSTKKITKSRILKTYVESIFLYNSETWTLTKNMEDSIDVFQRSQIRMAYGINWQDRMTNKELYKMSGLKPWSELIRMRRLRFFGHLHRMDASVPARIALDEANRKVRKPKGGQKTTWIKMMEKDLNLPTDTKLKPVRFQQILDLTQDRTMWRQECNRLMLAHANGRGD